MTTEARKLSVFLAILAMPWGVATVGLAGHASWVRQENNAEAARETDGAYRDGVFWGELDGRQGKKMQPGIARWNSEKDRASFKAGYEKGYAEVLASRNTEHQR